jgi:hypothetical protein
LVDGKRSLNPEVHDHESLGTDLEGQDFDRVGDKQTRPSQRIRDVENPDEGDDGASSGCAAFTLLLRRGDGPEDEAHAHGGCGGDEQGSATNAVNQHGAGAGDDERQNRETAIETKLGVCVGDTDGFVDVGGVVGDETVARPLREQTQGAEKHQPVPVSPGLEEVEVRRGLGVHELEADGFFDLMVFKLHRGVIDITIRVVFSKNIECFLVAVLRDQPTWGFRDEEDEAELDNGGKSLGKGGNSPAPVVLDSLSAEGEPCADDRSDVPETIVNGSDTTSVLGVAKLGEQQGRRELRKRVSETHEETSCHKHREILGGSLNGGTDNHDHTSKCNS